MIGVRRLGLRFRFNHAFVEYSGTGKAHDLRELSGVVKSKLKEYQVGEKELYFYTKTGIPLHSYQDIADKKIRIIIVDSSPRLQFTREL